MVGLFRQNFSSIKGWCEIQWSWMNVVLIVICLSAQEETVSKTLCKKINQHVGFGWGYKQILKLSSMIGYQRLLKINETFTALVTSPRSLNLLTRHLACWPNGRTWSMRAWCIDLHCITRPNWKSEHETLKNVNYFQLPSNDMYWAESWVQATRT